MARGRRKSKARAELYPREPLPNYAARDQEDRPVRRGDVVRRPSHVSPTLGVEVPTLVGVVVDVFRRDDQAPALLELRLDRDSRAAGTAVVRADHTRLSRAVIRGSTRVDWYGTGDLQSKRGRRG